MGDGARAMLAVSKADVVGWKSGVGVRVLGA